MNPVRKNNKFEISVSEDLGIRKFELVAKTEFLYEETSIFV